MKVVETWHNTWEISIAAGGLVTLACKCQTHFFRKTKKRSGPARAGTLSSATLTYTFSHFLFNFCVNWVLSALKGGVGVFLSSMREDHEKKILFVVLAVDNKCQIISVSKMSCRQGKGWSTDNLPCVKSSNLPQRCFFKIIFLTFSHSCFLLHFEIIRSVSWVWLKYFSAGGRLFYITRSQYVLFWQHVPKSCFSQTSVKVGVIHNLLRADLLFCCLHALRGDTLFCFIFCFVFVFLLTSLIEPFGQQVTEALYSHIFYFIIHPPKR